MRYPTSAVTTLSLVLAMAAPARADVAASGPSGFVVKIENTIAADPEKVFDTVFRLRDWWNSEHTYSGSALNLSLRNEPGGCFCERLADGGFVRHGTLEFSSRGKTLRITGGLGPLQGMGAYGMLALSFEKVDTGTKLVVTYTVHGFAAGNEYEKLPALVDEVMSDQFARLRRYVETGKPDEAKPATGRKD